VAFQRSATNARKMSNNFGKSVSQDDLVHHYWRPPICWAHERPRLVCERPLSIILARSASSRRSMVAADIEISDRSVSSLIFSSSNDATWDQLAHHRRQPLAGRCAEHRPAEPQRRNGVLVAIALVTARRWLIVSPMLGPTGQPRPCPAGAPYARIPR